MNSKYVNKNGEKKLLAVVAAFAMVFAFAGVFIAIDSDAAEETGVKSIPTSQEPILLTSSSSIVEGKLYYYAVASDITLTGNINGITIYLVDGAQVTFPSSPSTVTNVTVYAAMDGSATAAPTKYMAGLSYNAAVSGIISADVDGNNAVLKSLNATASDFKFGTYVNDGEKNIFYLDKELTVTVPKDKTYTVGFGSSTSKIIVQQLGQGAQAEPVNVIEVVPNESAYTGTITVAPTYDAEEEESILTVSTTSASNIPVVTVKKGAATVGETVDFPTFIGVATGETNVADVIVYPDIDGLVDEGVIVDSYYIYGDQVLSKNAELMDGKTITIPSGTLTIAAGKTLVNDGTITGNGTLVNFGTIKNGANDDPATEASDPKTGTISIKTFNNGVNADPSATPAIIGAPGIFENYSGSEITTTCTSILNAAGSQFIVGSGTLALFGAVSTFTNDGSIKIMKDATLTFGATASTLTQKGTIENEGTITIAASSTFEYDSSLTELSEKKAAYIKNCSGGELTIANTFELYLINEGEVTLTDGATISYFVGAAGSDVSGYTGAPLTVDNTNIAKVFFPGEVLEIAITNSVEAIGGPLASDGEGLRAFNSATMTEFYIVGDLATVSYDGDEFTIDGADSSATGDLYAANATVKITKMGANVVDTVFNGTLLIAADEITNGAVLTINGFAIISSDLGLSQPGQIDVKQNAKLFIYGTLRTVGLATNPAGFINNYNDTVVVTTVEANLKFLTNAPEITTVEVDGEDAIIDAAESGITVVKTNSATITFTQDVDLNGLTIVITSGNVVKLSDGITVSNVIFQKDASAESVVVEVMKTASVSDVTFKGVTVKTTNASGQVTTIVLDDVSVSEGTFAVGSLIITGDYEVAGSITSADGIIVIGAPEVVTTIVGTSTVNPNVITAKNLMINGEVSFNNVKVNITVSFQATADADVSGPAGVIVIGEGASIAVSSDAALDRSLVDNTANPVLEIASQAELITGMDYYDEFRLVAPVDFNSIPGVDGAPDQPFTIGKKTITLNGKNLTIVGEVIFNETTIVGDNNSKLIVATGNAASLTLNKANVYATVEDKDENITIKSALVSGWDTDSADTIKVGYGNTLNMKSVNIVSGKVITVYGILNIEGTTTVNPGASVIIKDGAVANNSGILTILGKELEGSVVVEGTLNNTGSIVVGDNNGSATMAVSGNVILKDGSSLNVKVAKSADKLDYNYLAGTGAVTVDAGATLTVNGTISVSSVYLKGTLGMNGTAAGTTVYLYDGVSVAVTSVAGTISFSDKYVVDEDVLKDDGVTQKENVIYSDGNQITLTNVKGVVVSESVKAGSVKIDEDNFKTYVCGLSISGVVSAIKDTYGSIEINNSAALYPSTVSSYVTPGKITVGDMALGKKVTLSTNGKVTVSGNLTAVEEDAEIFIGSTSKDMVTVTGLITCLDFELDGNLSAAMYSIHDTEKATETYYYTTFVAAVDAAPTAYENTVVLYGKITISEGITIAKPIVIELDSSAKVTIKGTADVVIDNGAKLDGSAGEITVTGTLKVVDKDSGIVEPVKEKFNYEVLLTDDADKQVVIYAGLVGVLKNAEAGQTVTMQKSATLSEDVEIKEGVTLVVPEKLTLFIGSDKNDVTLTVNGTIQVEKRAYIKPTQKDNMDVTIIVNGVISSYDEAEFSDFVSAVGSDSGVSVEKFTMTDFAYFNIDQKVYYWSNLTYAAENCHEGVILVQGQLTAGDIVFTEDEKATSDLIVVVYTPEGAKVNTNVYATSITLDGAAIIVYDEKSKVSTTVKGASLSGDASVIFDGASMVAIDSDYDEVKEENHLYIAGAPTGTITIAAGNVEVADAFAVYAAEDRSVEFTVADGATLTVPKDAEFASANAEDSDVLIIEGTLAVKNGGEAYLVNMYLAGTMTVESKDVTIVNSTIAGTLDVKEKTETTEEGLVSLDMVFVGDEPKSLGANGTVIGNIKVLSGDWFYVFNGSDVSKAKINYNIAEQKNDIKTTVVNINGDDVVTIYAYGSVDVYDALDAAEIELIGLETPAFDSTTKMYSAPTLKTEDLISDAANVKVGKYTNVYLDFALVGIHGMISQGQGVILMIDGNTIDNYRATLLGGDYVLSVGTYKVTYEPAYGYEDKGIKITFNGSVVTDGKITITADMKTFSLTVSDATPADPVTPITPVDPSQPEKDDGMGITEYLLIVLVILAAILVVVVAIRMMRN